MNPAEISETGVIVVSVDTGEFGNGRLAPGLLKRRVGTGSAFSFRPLRAIEYVDDGYLDAPRLTRDAGDDLLR